MSKKGKEATAADKAKEAAKEKAEEAKKRAEAKVKAAAKAAEEADKLNMLNETISAIKRMMAEEIGCKPDEIRDEDAYDVIDELHSSGVLDETLMDLGITPVPGFWSAISGWHDIQHLRTRGLGNKTAGLVGLATKAAVVGYGAFKAAEYLTKE